MQSRFFGSAAIIKSNQSIPRKKFQSEFLRFDESAYDYKQYKKNKKIGFLTFFSGVAAYTVGALVLENSQGSGIGLMVAGFTSYLFSIDKFVKSGNHLSRSVWHYNQNILMEE